MDSLVILTFLAGALTKQADIPGLSRKTGQLIAAACTRAIDDAIAATVRQSFALGVELPAVLERMILHDVGGVSRPGSHKGL
jgi:hypothetical protein